MTEELQRLSYYCSLDYDVRVVRLEDEDEFTYKAFVEELDSAEFYGIGETKIDALESFERVKNELFEYYLDNGLSIPEPTRFDEDLPSGKFLIRTSPSLHKLLITQSKKNKQSLNAYVNHVLVSYSTAATFGDFITDRFISQVENSQIQSFDPSSSISNPPVDKNNTYGKGKMYVKAA